MKLNSTQVNQTLSQFDAQVLPDSHPAVPQLNNLFGDHTFFLDGSGLNVLEPAETPKMEGQTGEIVSLASWSDATLTSLRPHEPEPTGVVIVLESKHCSAPDPAAKQNGIAVRRVPCQTQEKLSEGTSRHADFKKSLRTALDIRDGVRNPMFPMASAAVGAASPIRFRTRAGIGDQCSSIIMKTKPVNVAPTPKASVKEPTKTSIVVFGSALWLIRAMTPIVSMSDSTKAKARPMAMPIAV